MAKNKRRKPKGKKTKKTKKKKATGITIKAGGVKTAPVSEQQPPQPLRPLTEPLLWTDWEQGQLSEELTAKLKAEGAVEADEIWLNNLYQVLVYKNIIKGDSWPQMHWLSIKRLDRGWIHDWRELQRIKNDLVGPNFEAVELYPDERRLVDTANQYHLFVLANPAMRFPFGYNDRLVVNGGEAVDPQTGGTVRQRPFAPDDVPEDAVDQDAIEAMRETPQNGE